MPSVEESGNNTDEVRITKHLDVFDVTIVYRGRAVSVMHSVCVSVALVIQHKMHMRHIVTCGLPGSTTLFHTIS